MDDREDTISFEMNYCQHYKPKPGALNVSEWCMKGALKPPLRDMPCVGGHERFDDPTTVCEHWLRRTREMGEALADSFEKEMKDMQLLGPILSEWRKKEPIGKQEIIECPVCEGKLNLSQSSYNGHVHGRCETDGCFNWME